MVKGIGIDIIEIERVERAIKKNKRFIKRVFTDHEIIYFEKNNYNYHTIAGNFAAKEAVMKALGTGLREFKWTDVEIRRDSLGKPLVVLYNNAKNMADTKRINEVLITISHSKNDAVAQAMAI